MDASTYIGSLPDIDSTTLVPHDQTCRICLVDFEGTPGYENGDTDTVSDNAPEKAVQLRRVESSLHPLPEEKLTLVFPDAAISLVVDAFLLGLWAIIPVSVSPKFSLSRSYSKKLTVVTCSPHAEGSLSRTVHIGPNPIFPR